MTTDDKNLFQELKSKITNLEYKLENITKIDLPTGFYIVGIIIAVHLFTHFGLGW